mmetsp:Transcript_2845/g.4358  ORF Transcript_2845/g.4358 Transcript_2845/m.4358 type:complete len:181 (-) Transcript_2845:642-1184(-)
MLSQAISIQVAAATSVEGADFMSPSYSSSTSLKLVNTCKNCLQTFRIRRPLASDSDGFCSKDCQTCYSLFNSSPGNSPPQINQRKKAADYKSNNQLIFEFQSEINKQEDKICGTGNAEIADTAYENPAVNATKGKNHFIPKAVKKKSLERANSGSRWETAAPNVVSGDHKPTHPQLHAFF